MRQVEGGIDLVTVVVRGCAGKEVQKVVVDGVTLVVKGKLVGIDEAIIVERAGVKTKNKSRLNYIQSSVNS